MKCQSWKYNAVDFEQANFSQKRTVDTLGIFSQKDTVLLA